jgi:hypothetical protein
VYSGVEDSLSRLRDKGSPQPKYDIVMAGLDPATHAVRQNLVSPGGLGARAHQPVMQSRVGGRDTPGHDDVLLVLSFILMPMKRRMREAARGRH